MLSYFKETKQSLNILTCTFENYLKLLTGHALSYVHKHL